MYREFVVFRRRRENVVFERKGKPSDIKVGILLPIPYNAASASLFYQYAYTYLNSLDGVKAYRYVFDFKEKVLEALDDPLNLRKLDLILLSLSFELDYVTAAYILMQLGLLSSVKGAQKPVVIAGGVAPTANPLPLSGIVDAVVIGEAEEVLKDIVYSASEPNPLKLIRDHPCVVAPPFNEVKRRCFVKDLNSVQHPINQVYSVDEEPVYGYGFRVEVSRGCPHLCAFCMEAHIMYPFRYRNVDTLERIAEAGIRFLGIPRLVLYSLSLFSVPGIDSFLEKLAEKGVEASAPSIRLDHLNSKRLELIRLLGQKTLTIAPETLVPGYGCRIGKCFAQEKLVEVINEAYRLGFNHVKLYLITGFPDLALDEELKHFKEFISKIKTIRRGFVEITLNPLVPKPWTPYQFLPPIHVLKASEALDQYRGIAREGGIKVSVLDPDWAFAQAVIAQGSEETSRIVVEWARYGLGLSGFRKALQSADSNIVDYIKKGWSEPPWHRVVDMGIPIRYLELRARFLNILSSK
jgi:radical SAM superfamily enzyme YgiQ (UPF0313 family)